MKNTVTKSGFLKNSLFGSVPYKKHRRRRYRNKNSSLKKKKLRKCYFSKNSDNFKFNKDTEKIMSNWYWSNYRKAVEWQDRHKIAHWKSCALALLEENRYLLQIINSMQPGMPAEVPVTQNLEEGLSYSGMHKYERPKNFSFHHKSDGDEDGNLKDEGDDDDDEEDDIGGDDDNASDEDNEETNDEFEFEMSEEMIKFFEQSYKHKMEQKKLKEKEMLNNTEQEIKKIQTNKLKRSTEMSLLYGEGASMITGMETAVQLSFDKYCDTKSPKYWPNIPFRL